MSQNLNWIAVDWGTSNLRAWGMSADGETLFSCSSHEGMGKLEPRQFPQVLTNLLSEHISDGRHPVDTLICGMAGARQGWIEAPYIEAPAQLDRLLQSAVRPTGAEDLFSARILPGVCQKTAGQEDVMRGEETQLLGLTSLLPGFSGLVVMPGTHSKWVQLDGHRLARFATAMTGELFAVLSTHSVLRYSASDKAAGPERDEGFDAGLALGLQQPARLTSNLFKTRAAGLVASRSVDWSTGYLSGLLIGAEIGGQRDWLEEAEIPLVGGSGLCRLYQKGFTLIGAKTRIIDATEATLAGLKAARTQGAE